MGTVIKAGGGGKRVKRLETLKLQDHMAEANAVVQAAHTKAARIAEHAKKLADQAYENARRTGLRNGFKEGRATGHEAGRKEAFDSGKAEFNEHQKNLISSLSRLTAEFESHKRELLERARHDLLTLAVKLAERITKRVGAVDRLAAVANATEAIRHVGHRTDLVIRIHSDDRDAMNTYAGTLSAELDMKEHLAVVVDDTISPGGCIVQSPETQVDATLDQQLAQAVALLLGDADESSNPTPGGQTT